MLRDRGASRSAFGQCRPKLPEPPLEEVSTRVYRIFDPENISESYRRRILNVIYQS